jgi:two-component system cell cycle sensor histidine kinase/response regulator CckA
MKTILALEDDPGNMQAFRAVLSSMGYRVLEATTGREALEISNKQYEPFNINLFLSDISLPDLSGTEVALLLIQRQSDLPILFVSGTPIDHWAERDRRNFRQLSSGPVDFLEKPFRASTLQTKVESLMKSHSSVSDARR